VICEVAVAVRLKLLLITSMKSYMRL